jgi:hypothetical protein
LTTENVITGIVGAAVGAVVTLGAKFADYLTSRQNSQSAFIDDISARIHEVEEILKFERIECDKKLDILRKSFYDLIIENARLKSRVDYLEAMQGITIVTTTTTTNEKKKGDAGDDPEQEIQTQSNSS